MALAYSGIEFEIREVALRNKPAAMLALSAKGTVPVMQLEDQVIDESLEILYWSLSQNDPHGWMMWSATRLNDMRVLVEDCEHQFKPNLDGYKYHHRDSQLSQEDWRRQGEIFLAALELQLETGGGYLFGERISFADIAIFPFVRQFAHVDKNWFDQAGYGHLGIWLEGLLSSGLFLSVMKKYSPWQVGDEPILFGY